MSSNLPGKTSNINGISKNRKKDLRNLAEFLDLIENIDIKLSDDRNSLRTPSPEQESLDMNSDTSDSEKSIGSDSSSNDRGNNNEDYIVSNEAEIKKCKSIKYVWSHIPTLRDKEIIDKFDAKYSGREYLKQLKSRKIINNVHNFKSKKIDLTEPHIKKPKLLLELLGIEEESYVVTGKYSCNNKTLLGKCERFPDASAYVKMKKRWKREVAKWKIQRRNKKSKSHNKEISSPVRSSSPPGFSRRS